MNAMSAFEPFFMIARTAGPLLLIFGVLQSAWSARRGDQRGSQALIAGVMMSVLGWVGPWAFKGLLGSPAKAPAAEPTPTPTPSTPSVTTEPFTLNLNIVVIAALATVLLVAASVLVRTVLPRLAERRARAAEAANVRDLAVKAWGGWLDRYRVVDQKFLEFDRDLELLLRYPMLRDYRQPETVAVVEAMTLCRPLATDEPPADVADIDGTEFAQAVRTYEARFATAMAVARQANRSRLSRQEQESLRLARQLLAVAQDSGASPAERRSAYERVIKTLRGFLTIDDTAVQQLETSVPLLAIAAT